MNKISKIILSALVATTCIPTNLFYATIVENTHEVALLSTYTAFPYGNSISAPTKISDIFLDSDVAAKVYRALLDKGFSLTSVDDTVIQSDLDTITSIFLIQNEHYDVAGVEYLQNLLSLTTTTDTTNFTLISTLPSLQQLYVYNQGSATLTQADLDAIGNIATLDTLSLEIAEINLGFLHTLSNLKNLHLWGIKLNTAHFADIHGIALSELTIATPDYFADFSKLTIAATTEILTLVSKGYIEMPTFADINSIVELNIHTLGVQDIEKIGQMQNLEFLELGAQRSYIGTQLVNQTDIGELSFIKNLHKLKIFSLINGTLRDVAPLAHLTNLQALTLDGNQIEDISALSNLTNLEIISVNRNKLTDITPLSNLQKLEMISLGSNKITDVTPLATIAPLVYLSVAENRIKDISSVNHVDWVLAQNQIILLEEAFIGPTTTLKNVIKDIDGNPLAPTLMTGNAAYYPSNDTFYYTALRENDIVAYNFTDSVMPSGFAPSPLPIIPSEAELEKLFIRDAIENKSISTVEKAEQSETFATGRLIDFSGVVATKYGTTVIPPSVPEVKIEGKFNKNTQMVEFTASTKGWEQDWITVQVKSEFKPTFTLTSPETIGFSHAGSDGYDYYVSNKLTTKETKVEATYPITEPGTYTLGAMRWNGMDTSTMKTTTVTVTADDLASNPPAPTPTPNPSNPNPSNPSNPEEHLVETGINNYAGILGGMLLLLSFITLKIRKILANK